MGNNVKKMLCEILGGGGGGFNNQTGPILLSSNTLTYINLHVKYGNNHRRSGFLVKIQNMILVFIFGGPWAILSNPGIPKFHGRKTSSQHR